MKKVVSAVSIVAVCLSCFATQVGQAAETLSVNPPFSQYAGISLAKARPQPISAGRHVRFSLSPVDPAVDELLMEKLVQKAALSIELPVASDRSFFERDLYPYGFGEDRFEYSLKGFGHQKLHQIHFAVSSRYWVYGAKGREDWYGGFCWVFRFEPKIKDSGFSYR